MKNCVLKNRTLFPTITKNSNSFIKLLRNLDIEINLGEENVVLDTHKNRLRDDMTITVKDICLFEWWWLTNSSYSG